ncbi:hypothetical protein [Ideonella sp. B508-1]|uniref:hypothetical protein n=1 Tax=Ideonella sp. B508-1 TaxID=137716 RepID=UPI00034B116D|nr:hypothetical protein [Ideonella sp. B508-1]
MRAAPPAACVLADCGLWRVAHLALPAVSLAALAWAVFPGQLQYVTLAALAAAGFSGWLWRRRTPLMLVWNGAEWSLGARQGGRVSLLWDGGCWMLARWHADASGTGRWLMLDRADAVSAADWHALRVALVQPVNPRGRVREPSAGPEVA